MQVAARGPPGATNTRDDLSCLHRVARMDTDGIEVVVGGDESVAVIDFHPVAATPGVPSSRANNTGVSCVDGCAAGRGIVLAQVEITSGPADRTDPETERRTRIEKLKRGHQKTGARPAQARRPYRQVSVGSLRRTPYCRVREGQGDQRIGHYRRGRKGTCCADLVRRRRNRFPLCFLDIATPGSSTGDSSTLGPGARNRSRQLHRPCRAGRKVDGIEGSREHPCSGGGAGNGGKGTLVRLPVAGH
jgi:hypothetical protein